jgi:hypothetical protein
VRRHRRVEYQAIDVTQRGRRKDQPERAQEAEHRLPIGVAEIKADYGAEATALRR